MLIIYFIPFSYAQIILPYYDMLLLIRLIFSHLLYSNYLNISFAFIFYSYLMLSVKIHLVIKLLIAQRVVKHLNVDLIDLIQRINLNAYLQVLLASIILLRYLMLILNNLKLFSAFRFFYKSKRDYYRLLIYNAMNSGKLIMPFSVNLSKDQIFIVEDKSLL